MKYLLELPGEDFPKKDPKMSFVLSRFICILNFRFPSIKCAFSFCPFDCLGPDSF